jgi:hypothetical protein
MSRNFANQVLQHVLKQAQADTTGLKSLPYANWRERVGRSIRSFVPDLVSFGPDLIKEVQLTLNSPQLIREAWESLRDVLYLRGLIEDIKEETFFITSELERESRLLAEITGETVSSLIADFLCRARPDFQKNNRSTYPDLYFNWADYSILPRRTAANPSGPALKGTAPTSVPDGVEIKSQRGKSIRVDCHHPHQGMHLVMTFGKTTYWEVHNLFIAYLSKADYRRATRNTTATTEKFSFGQAPFISVIDGSVECMELAN